MELLILLSIAVLAVMWPRTCLTIAALLVLATATVRYANADTLEVAAIIESEADRVSMQDAVRDADAIFGQLGLDLTVTYIEVGEVAAHTHAKALLDAVKAHRWDSAVHQLADATVLFTRRDIKMGTSDLAGIATVGPACSSGASAVVELRNDGFDGAILAHELLHTVGVPHDHAQGWLMSEGISRVTAATVSPDSLATFRAAGAECFTPAANPPPAAVSAPAAPSDSGTGGGGCMEVWLLLALVVLLAWVKLRDLQDSVAFWKQTATERLAALEKTNQQLRDLLYKKLRSK